VEISGWRNELRLRVGDRRRHRLPHIEVFQATTPHDDDDDGTPSLVGRHRRRFADDRWHTVTIAVGWTSPGVGRTADGGFHVRVYVDCRLVSRRRVDEFRLPWSPGSDFDDLSYVWVGQRSETESVLKASAETIKASSVNMCEDGGDYGGSELPQKFDYGSIVVRVCAEDPLTPFPNKSLTWEELGEGEGTKGIVGGRIDGPPVYFCGTTKHLKGPQVMLRRVTVRVRSENILLSV